VGSRRGKEEHGENQKSLFSSATSKRRKEDIIKNKRVVIVEPEGVLKGGLI